MQVTDTNTDSIFDITDAVNKKSNVQKGIGNLIVDNVKINFGDKISVTGKSRYGSKGLEIYELTNIAKD